MKTLAAALELIISSLKHNSIFMLKIIGGLWLLQTFNWVLQYRLNILGIIPRTLIGLRGIVCAPFLHGDFSHLFFNSVPLFVLANLILVQGRTTFYAISLFIIIVGGTTLWLVGKRGIHIGASTLIMGYFGFLLAGAYFKITATTILVAIICLYYFGGLVLALFPSSEKHISWEGHVCGFLAGITAAYFSTTILHLFSLVSQYT